MLFTVIWRHIAREDTRHMGYSFRVAARILLYALSHTQDYTYHNLCYTSRGALAGTRNISMGICFFSKPMTDCDLLRPIPIIETHVHHKISQSLCPDLILLLPSATAATADTAAVDSKLVTASDNTTTNII